MNQPRCLRAEALTKTYGAQTVLERIDFTLEPGCICGLIGRNGAGKTTLLGLLSGQNPATAGRVTYGGAPVWGNADALGELCLVREGNTAQGGAFASLRVKDYLTAGKIFFPGWDEAYAARLVRTFGLERKKRMGQLSRGQASMLGITLALASRAPVTMLDEPTAGLDVVAREQFYRLILEDYAETKRTYLISTHMIEESAPLFERVTILDAGRILESCPADELLAGFRRVSGPQQSVLDAVRAAGAQCLRTEALGRHSMAAVRGTPQAMAALDAAEGIQTVPMNLQDAFVALCGQEEG